MYGTYGLSVEHPGFVVFYFFIHLLTFFVLSAYIFIIFFQDFFEPLRQSGLLDEDELHKIFLNCTELYTLSVDLYR